MQDNFVCRLDAREMNVDLAVECERFVTIEITSANERLNLELVERRLEIGRQSIVDFFRILIRVLFEPAINLILCLLKPSNVSQCTFGQSWVGVIEVLIGILDEKVDEL